MLLSFSCLTAFPFSQLGSRSFLGFSLDQVFLIFFFVRAMCIVQFASDFTFFLSFFPIASLSGHLLLLTFSLLDIFYANFVLCFISLLFACLFLTTWFFVFFDFIVNSFALRYLYVFFICSVLVLGLVLFTLSI